MKTGYARQSLLGRDGLGNGAGRLRSSDSTQTKQTGTNTTPSSVAPSMPPITPVPMARWLAAPAPVARVSGTTPRMNARRS